MIDKSVDENDLEIKRKLFHENYVKELNEQKKRQTLGKKEFKFYILKNTGCMPYGDFLESLYEDYIKRVELYRKTHGNNANLSEVPLIMVIQSISTIVDQQ
jgi:hypothetical protein